MTVSEAGKVLGLKASQVKALLANGEIQGQRLGTHQNSPWDIDEASLQSYIAQKELEGPPTETHTKTASSWQIDIPRTRIHTIDELIKHAEIDLDTWEIERFIVNKWEVGTKDPQGEVTVTPLFQVKAWLKKKVEVVAVRAEIEDIKATALKSAPKPFPVKFSTKKTGSKNLLELSILDHHFGKLAWAPETGGEHYDTKIAKDLYEGAVEALVARSKGFPIDRIMFVVGHDLLHIDNRRQTTERGTPLDVDSRYHKLFKITRQVVREQIERLLTLAPVDVIVVPGNHDKHSSWHLGDSLEIAFEKYSDVSVNNSPAFRKYYRWGKVMLMHTHGENTKKRGERLPLVMAAEEREMFGQTRFHEVHLGHLHESSSIEMHGVRVRRLPSLAPCDAWFSENEFVGNLRSSEAYIWNVDEGLIGTAVYNAERS